MTSLKELQQQAGAVFSENEETPVSFPQNSPAIDHVNEIVLCDRSNWGLLSLAGEDRARFLHNQSTNNIEGLKVGEGCDTVFVTSTGRNIDLVTAYIRKEDILLLVSPNKSQDLYNWMDRYIFPFDKVNLTDLSADFAIFTLIGEQSQELLSELVEIDQLESNENSHHTVTIAGKEILLTKGCNLKISGYNLIVPQADAATIWQQLTDKQPQLIGTQEFEALRILQGRPKPDAELTEEYNPLESGLWHAISFEKGCYIGQETIARLNTYKGVKQRLWGIKLNQAIDPKVDQVITLEDEKIGKITSYFQSDHQYFALGYIRTKAGGEGLSVNVGNSKGELVALPFVHHQYFEP